MVEAVTKQHPVVNLDEFERRLRGPVLSARDSPSARDSEDPLAELARLVNGEGARPPADPFKAMFATSAASRPAHAPDPDFAAASAPVIRLPVANWDRHEPVNSTTPEHAEAGYQDNFDPNDQQAVFEREMRALQADAPRSAHAHASDDQHHEFAGTDHDGISPLVRRAQAGPHDEAAHEHHHHDGGEDFAAGEDDNTRTWPPQPEPLPRQRAPSRRPAMIMGAIACVGLTLIGGTFAMRANGASGTRTVALIKANDEPVKIAPKSPGGSVVANQDASILDKVSGAKISSDVVATTRVATKDEQPIDLAQAPKPAKTVIPAGQAVTIAVAPPAPLQQPPAAGAIFGEPKRVKTVQVRPDGSVISGSAGVTPALGAQAATPSAAAPGTPPARPALTSLPITTPKAAPAAVAAAPVAANAGPAVPVAKAPAPKATVRAIAIAKAEPKPDAKPEPKPDAAADAPLQLGPGGKNSKAAKIRLADAGPSASAASAAAAPRDATASSGSFAVQLGATPKEAEARDMSSRVGKQYAAALDGHQPSVRAGEKDGSPIYRVRVGNLTRDDANALCTKLKASGGSCFVAGN